MAVLKFVVFMAIMILLGWGVSMIVAPPREKQKSRPKRAPKPKPEPKPRPKIAVLEYRQYVSHGPEMESCRSGGCDGGQINMSASRNYWGEFTKYQDCANCGGKGEVPVLTYTYRPRVVPESFKLFQLGFRPDDELSARELEDKQWNYAALYGRPGWYTDGSNGCFSKNDNPRKMSWSFEEWRTLRYWNGHQWTFWTKLAESHRHFRAGDLFFKGELIPVSDMDAGGFLTDDIP